MTHMAAHSHSLRLNSYNLPNESDDQNGTVFEIGDFLSFLPRLDDTGRGEEGGGGVSALAFEPINRLVDF